MIEIIEQAGRIFTKTHELMRNPQISGPVLGFLAWINSTVFKGRKTAQEKLKRLEQPEADARTVADLQANLELLLEGNEPLLKELAARLKALELMMEQAGVQTTKTNTVHVVGDSNKVYQDVSHSTITDNSVQ